jgi:hypothetical protein
MNKHQDQGDIYSHKDTAFENVLKNGLHLCTLIYLLQKISFYWHLNLNNDK